MEAQQVTSSVAYGTLVMNMFEAASRDALTDTVVSLPLPLENRYIGFEEVTGKTEYLEDKDYRGYREVPVTPNHMTYRHKEGTTAIATYGITFITFVKVDPIDLEARGFTRDDTMLVPCSSPRFDD